MTNTSFDSLPQRIFLDSSTLQRIYDYGGFIWENEPISPNDEIRRVPQGIEELATLRNIFFVHQRAMWEFIISKSTLDEVNAKHERGYSKYSLDVFDYSTICIEESDISPRHSINEAENIKKILSHNLSQKDLKLVIEAQFLACDSFLTCDRKLVKSKEIILKHLEILIMSPVSYWEMIKPWARLYV